MGSTFRLRGGLVIGVALAVLTLCACSTKTPAAGGLGGLSTVKSTTSANPTSAVSTPTSTSTPKQPTSNPTHKATTPAGPKIVQFNVKQKPACPIIATSDAPFSKDAVDIILEWKVTGATQVALSLDDKNFFKTYHTGSIQDYPTTDEVQLSFACDPANQPNTTHTYTLDTIGGTGGYVQKSLTVTVRTSP
jgi:hypothetical protein